MLLTVIAFIIVLGVLIFVHELGHFLAAKAVGIGVPRFSIGFGPATPIVFRWGETEYRVAWIPLGGYVKMASKEEQEAMESVEGGAVEEEFPPDKLFESKSLAARILVISAGVLMNALFGWIAYSALMGIRGEVQLPTTTIAAVDTARLPLGAEALGTLPPETEILHINRDTVQTWREVISAVADPTSDQLRFDFAGGVDPAILPIPGVDAESRVAVIEALTPFLAARLGQVEPGSRADEAGLLDGDEIQMVADATVRTWDELRVEIERYPGVSVTLTVLREGRTFSAEVTPEAVSQEDPETGAVQEVGKIGIGVQRHVRYGLAGAVVAGARESWDRAALVLFTLKGMVVGQISPRELGGPIMIGQVSGQFARLGPAALISFMAFLSINLAILNLLPIPVLDGGHLVFLFIEGIRGKPLSLAMRLRLTQIGLFLLLGIMVLALTNDVLRVFGG